MSTHWPAGFWLTDLSHLWEQIFTNLGIALGAQKTCGSGSGLLTSALMLSLSWNKLKQIMGSSGHGFMGHISWSMGHFRWFRGSAEAWWNGMLHNISMPHFGFYHILYETTSLWKTIHDLKIKMTLTKHIQTTNQISIQKISIWTTELLNCHFLPAKSGFRQTNI